MKSIFNIKKQSVLLLCFIFLNNCGDTRKKNVNFKKYLNSLTPEIKDVIDSYPYKYFLQNLVEKNNAKEFDMYIDTPKIKLISPQQELQLNKDQKTLMCRKLEKLISKEEMELCINKKYKKLKYLVYAYTKINGCLEIKNMILKYILGELVFRKIENLNIRNFSKTPKVAHKQGNDILYCSRSKNFIYSLQVENPNEITKQFLSLYTKYSDNYLGIILLHKIYNKYINFNKTLFTLFFRYLHFFLDYKKMKKKSIFQGYINISNNINKPIIIAMNIKQEKYNFEIVKYLKNFIFIKDPKLKKLKMNYFNLHFSNIPQACFFF